MQSVVIVEWADAHQSTMHWTSITELDNSGERMIRTVGFLLTVEDGGKEEHITIAQSWDNEEELVDNVLHIPISMVRQMSAVQFVLVSGAISSV